MLTTIDADTTQLFAGANLTQDDTPECTACNRTLREGEQITIYAARKEDAPTFRIERIYCRECTPEELTSPTLGLNEYLLGGRITRTLDVRTQREFQTLHEPQALTTSAPSEGTTEAHDEHEDPPALIRQPQTQNPASAIYHLDNGEGTLLCNCETEFEYTRVPLADAEASPARCCRNCQIAQQGGQETRPCPRCDEQIPLSRWPNTSERVRVIQPTPPTRPIPTATLRSPTPTRRPSRLRAQRHPRAIGPVPARTPNCRSKPRQRWAGPLTAPALHAPREARL